MPIVTFLHIILDIQVAITANFELQYSITKPPTLDSLCGGFLSGVLSCKQQSLVLESRAILMEDGRAKVKRVFRAGLAIKKVTLNTRCCFLTHCVSTT